MNLRHKPKGLDTFLIYPPPSGYLGLAACSRAAFTLVEILIATAIFAVVSTIVAGQYADAFRETRKANFQNQIYEDARFIMDRIADEIRSGTVDYDEYYNQSVVIPTFARDGGLLGAPAGLQNFGQNFGRYYSAFFNPGSDNKLGFDCNDGGARNRRTCIPLRRTIDLNTGENPYAGKAALLFGDENAFCGTVRYSRGGALTNIGKAQSAGADLCLGDGSPDLNAIRDNIKELYLISADGRQKTIFARERIGGTDADPAYALSMLRLKGIDTDGDNISDIFVCADDFNCLGPSVGAYGNLPRENRQDLSETSDSAADSSANAFSKDFAPVSPLRVKITNLQFIISPLEDTHYAFAENARQQPRATVILTVAPNPEYSAASFPPFTISETIPSHLRNQIPTSLLIY